MLPLAQAIRPFDRRHGGAIKTLGFLAFLLLGSIPASATTLRHLGLGDLVRASDTIVLGRVESTRAFWQGKQIYTEVTLAVTRSLKGARSDRTSFLQLGGRVDSPVPLQMTVPGAPIHSVGDEAYFFLQPGKPGERILVGLFQGKVPVRRDGQGEYVMSGGARKTTAGFEEEIRRQIAGQKQDRAGGVQ